MPLGGESMAQNTDNSYDVIIYSEDPLKKKSDNTLKQFFDRFYVIPKEDGDGVDYTNEQIEFLKQKTIHLIHDEVKQGRNGFIVFRGRKKKILTEDQCKEIRESNLTQMKLSEIYGVSIGTINKVKNNKY